MPRHVCVCVCADVLLRTQSGKLTHKAELATSYQEHNLFSPSS